MTPTKPKVYVVDTLWRGHVPSYHKLILQSLKSLRYDAVSVSPMPEQVEQWQLASKCIKIADDLLLYQPESTLLKKLGLLHYMRFIDFWEKLDKLLTANNILPSDVVFIPYLDNLIISPMVSGETVDKLFKHKWAGLYVTPKYMRAKGFKYFYKKLMRKDKFLNAKNNLAMSFLDNGVGEKAKELFPQKIILSMPEIANFELEKNNFKLLKQLQDFKGDSKLVGLFGEISERKGMTTLLKAAENLREKNIKFVFVGHSDGEFAATTKNCFMYLKRVASEAEFNSLFNLCDVIFAAYNGFYNSSNIMSKAAGFKKPIIVSSGFYMEEQVLKYNLGLSIQENDSTACAQAIEAIIGNDSKKYGFDRYLKDNSEVQMDRFFNQLLMLENL